MTRATRLTLPLMAWALSFSGLAHAATINVNDASDTGSKSDGRMSLREALQLADGDFNMQTCVGLGETKQVHGNVTWVPSVACPFQGLYDLAAPISDVGKGKVDTIVLDTTLGNLRPTHELNWLEGRDVLEGSNQVLVGNLAGQANGLVVAGLQNGMVRNLTIQGFSGDGLFLTGVVGFRLRGLTVNKNGRHGIEIVNDATFSSSNLIGGSAPGEGNFISENGQDGILVSGSSNAISGSNVIVGNVVGLETANATGVRGNRGYGLHFVNSSGNTVGGTTTAARNVIVGSGVDGIKFEGARSSANLVQGNLIGTNATLATGMGNTWSGVSIVSDANNNTIGGDASAANTVVGGLYGIFIGGTANVAQNKVLSNFIGTDPTFHSGLGISWGGVVVTGGAHDNAIGGPGQGNRIVNSGVGIDIAQASNNSVLANAIGFAGFNAPMPNGMGVQLRDGAANNTIGTVAAPNTIAFNTGVGIYVTGAGSNQNLITGNFVGVDSLGTPMGNHDVGIYLDSPTTGTLVSQVSVANNQFAGVGVAAGSFGNKLSFTTVHDNNGPGVDLNVNGVGCSGSTGGNRCMPVPGISSVSAPSGGKVTVSGWASPGAVVQLYVPAGNLNGVGGGLAPVVTDPTSLVANNAGIWRATIACTGAVNATQTDGPVTNNGTSEFSRTWLYKCQ